MRTPLFPVYGAELSACRRYRFKLWRHFGLAAPDLLTFCMLNPSTADASEDDPTVRRCMGFAKDFGFGGIMIVNLYAIRSKSPKAIKAASDPIGIENDGWIFEVAHEAKQVVCAWGGDADPVRAAHVTNIIRRAGADTSCLGVNNDGSPKHPLYLKRSAQLQPFSGSGSYVPRASVIGNE